MIGRNAILKAELIEQLPLIIFLLAHHVRCSLKTSQGNGITSDTRHQADFFNEIRQVRTSPQRRRKRPSRFLRIARPESGEQASV
jgi:hypothetical protein